MFRIVRHLSIVACHLLWFAPAVFSQSERSLVREGNRAYEKQQYADAEVNYRKALEVQRDFQQGIFNLGDALYKQERFEEAAEQYRNVAAKTMNPTTRAQAFHNLGNALLKAQKLPESIEAYKEALKHNPNDFDTKYNLEYAKRLLQQQQNQQQQQKGDEQRKNQQQQKNQQNEDKQEQQQQRGEEQRKEQERDQQSQQRQQHLSKEDAERILEALKNEEQQVQKKLMKKIPARVRVEKDW